MPRRKRGGTAARARKSRKRVAATPTPRRAPTARTLARRRTATKLPARTRSQDDSPSARPGRISALLASGRPADRRRKVAVRKPRRATRTGLPEYILPPRRDDENARSRSPTRCARKKEVRRGVIIATGYGGLNHTRNYKEHRKCR